MTRRRRQRQRVTSKSAGKFIGKRIVLGVSGSIAAYKAVSLLRALVGEGARVSVVMTEAATRFVTPLTFEVLSGRAVATDLFAAREEMLHLTLAEEADLVVIAPATAHVLARCALGLADDLLTTLVLAARCPLVLAPAMDGGMWNHPAVQTHARTLRERGVMVVEPEEGPLASGRIGSGRLAAEAAVLGMIERCLSPRLDWTGQRVLVSAGPTQEAIDPVRFLSNRSSGKMGYALAGAARERGAEVVLVSGPTALPEPAGVERVSVCTAEEMRKALASRFGWATLLIMAAAVADFRPTRVAVNKLKKGKAPPLRLDLEPTEDILQELAARRTSQVLVGFAAETEELVANAQEKLRKKALDLVVANDVTVEGAGFGSELNSAMVVGREGVVADLPLMPKREMADRILDAIQGFRRRAGGVFGPPV
jgi:phosphopantothenoylcysteine decarboxylase/phosphopantothenate--cysteine ligase